MTLTDAGQVFYESALRVVDGFGAAESLVGRGQSRRPASGQGDRRTGVRAALHLST